MTLYNTLQLALSEAVALENLNATLTQNNALLTANVAELQAELTVAKARIAELEAAAPKPTPEPEPTPTPTSYFSGDWKAKHNVKFPSYEYNASQVEDPVRGTVLEIKVPKGNMFGFACHVPVPPAEDVTRTYDVFFPTNYQWTTPSGGGSGKLPGLAGTIPGVPEWACSGGGKRWNGTTQITRLADINKMTGYSNRLLWMKDRRLKCYLYVPDPNHLGSIPYPEKEGTTGWRCHGWSFELRKPGTTTPLKLQDGWNTISVRNKMNTLGKADGICQVWLNGVKGLDITNIIFRTRSDLKVSQDFMTWIHGGPTSDYPTVDTQRIRLDNFRFGLV